MSSANICIGLSCCLFHEDKTRTVYNGRPLLYVVESLPRYLMARGALVFMIPPLRPGKLSYREAEQTSHPNPTVKVRFGKTGTVTVFGICTNSTLFMRP